MKVGLLAHDFLTWQGGRDFLDIFVRALLSGPQKIECFLILPVNGPRAWFRSIRLSCRALAKTSRWKWSPPDQQYRLSELTTLDPSVTRCYTDLGRHALLRCIERNNLELLLPAVHSLGKDFPIPWIGYAYDFQHRYYGNYFTYKDRLSRDSHFEAIFNDPEVTVVNSRSVASDAEHFVHPIRSSISVLPFTPFLRSEWLKTDEGILERYGLVKSSPYFLISNQFWPHKNHRVACEAARLLRRKGAEFSLAFTGTGNTMETESTLASLKKDFSDLISDGTLRLLGWIPKADQIDLTKKASAVIQPSLFEGGPGGGAAYHALALGQRLIASDLPVNREINTGQVSFFPPDSADALAVLMENCLQKDTLIPSPDWEALKHQSEANLKECGYVIHEAISLCLKRFDSRRQLQAT